MVPTLAAAALVIWVYLLLARGLFWTFRQPPEPPPLRSRPRVAVVIPARNEEASIGQAVASLRRQDYTGPFHIFVADDHSSDRTAAAAEGGRVTVIPAAPLPTGWAGKVWAMQCGVGAAAAFHPDYFFFSDADIVHAPGSLAEAVARAEAGPYDLVSSMVRLRCESPAERVLVPAFVFFFFKLYPPAWATDPHRATAGAAGGSILLRRAALDRSGGLETIRGAVIDDCALAAAVKSAGGKLWLGLASETYSIRPYPTWRDAARMISRTAYTQLRYSPLRLAGAVAGMCLTYLVPPVLAFSAPPAAAAWLLMALAYLPALRFYDRSPLWAPFLPLVAVFYTAATIYSAVAYYRGRGAAWKGRAQAHLEAPEQTPDCYRSRKVGN